MTNSKLKDSNIEWLGKIPSNWNLIKGKYLFTLRTTKGNTKQVELLSPTQEYGVIPQKLYEKLTGMRPVKLKSNTDLNQMKSIYKGDFCISLRSFQGGFEYSNYNGIVSPAYQVFYPSKQVNRNYFKYLFKDKSFIQKLNSYTMSLRDGKNIAFSDFGNTYLPFPALDEQNKIADFLDKKVSQIDNLSKNIQQEITDLEDYRKSIIVKAVTKGLNPDVPMKDSGIPWIGKMPENWKLERVKLITTSLNKGISPNYIIAKGTPIITQAMFSQGYLNFHNIKYGSDPFELNQKGQVKSEDILFATTGGGVLGKVFFVDQIKKSYLASADVCIIRTNNKVFSSKLLYYIFSINYNLFNGLMATGSTNQIHLNMFQFKNMHIPVMPKTDQKKILKFIDQKASKINKLIDKKNKILDFLNQYKQSIIYEYVTGKKQVPTEEGAVE